MKRMIFLFQPMVLIALVYASSPGTPRPLERLENEKLYDICKENIKRTSSSIEISFSKETLYSKQLREERELSRQQKNTELKNNNSNRQLKSFGSVTESGEELFLYNVQVYIKGTSKYREDIVIIDTGDSEKENYDSIHVNNDGVNFKIDNKRKLVTYNEKSNWGTYRDTLGYGTFAVDWDIMRDIRLLCRTENDAKSRRKVFRHKGLSEINGTAVDAIELFDREKGIPIYELSLGTNDWGKCLKVVLYNEKGSDAKRIWSFSDFIEDKNDKTLYPHLIIDKFFDEEGKEKMRHTINVKEVEFGPVISDDVFELNVTDDYTILGR